jgi:hypothetical protein
VQSEYAIDEQGTRRRCNERSPIERLANKYGVDVSEVIPLIGATEDETARNIRAWVQQHSGSDVGYNSGYRRYGYTVDGTPIADEQTVIADVARMRREGRSYREIAETLNSMGIHGAKGGRWVTSTIRRLIMGGA